MQPAPLSAEVDAAQLAAQLLQRASVLRDEQQIENLQRIYGYYIDRNMWDAAADPRHRGSRWHDGARPHA